LPTDQELDAGDAGVVRRGGLQGDRAAQARTPRGRDPGDARRAFVDDRLARLGVVLTDRRP
jgi:hypothetical protein